MKLCLLAIGMTLVAFGAMERPARGAVSLSTAHATEPTSRPADGPAVRAVFVLEHRARSLAPVHDVEVLGDELTLRVAYSDAIQFPTGYGVWHITQARDNLGDDVRPPLPPPESAVPKNAKEFEAMLSNARDSVGSNDDFDSLQLPEQLKDDRNTGATDFEVTTRVGLPPRAASRLSRVAGDFTLYSGGTPKKLNFNRPTRFYGKTLDDPALKAAGVSIELLPPNTPAPTTGPLAAQPEITDANHVRLLCRGNLRALYQPMLQIVDARSNDVNAGWDTDLSPSEPESVASVGVSRPLDDAMSIEVFVAVGQRPVVIPFDLHDLALP